MRRTVTIGRRSGNHTLRLVGFNLYKTLGRDDSCNNLFPLKTTPSKGLWDVRAVIKVGKARHLNHASDHPF